MGQLPEAEPTGRGGGRGERLREDRSPPAPHLYTGHLSTMQSVRGAGSLPLSRAGAGQSQGARRPWACRVQPHRRLGSAKHKQSLNRNVTEEIIAISNDNTQFSRRRLADLGVRPTCQAARLPQAGP